MKTAQESMRNTMKRVKWYISLPNIDGSAGSIDTGRIVSRVILYSRRGMQVFHTPFPVSNAGIFRLTHADNTIQPGRHQYTLSAPIVSTSNPYSNKSGWVVRGFNRHSLMIDMHLTAKFKFFLLPHDKFVLMGHNSKPLDRPPPLKNSYAILCTKEPNEGMNNSEI